jgi:putative ABC transport system permease protein
VGEARLFARLGVKDLRHHLTEALLLFLVIAAATATLTLGLVLHGETDNPFNATRAATRGPDVVANLSPDVSRSGAISANASPEAMASLEHAPGVTGRGGPFPVTFALVRTRGITTSAMLEGRDAAPASLDQPSVSDGTWVHKGGVVVERSFADALSVHVGDALTLNGRLHRIVGIAVDAAVPPYPHICAIGCGVVYRNAMTHSPLYLYEPGLIWVSRADLAALASPQVGVSYLENLKLAHPDQAPAFAATASRTPSSGSALTITSWQKIAAGAAKLVRGPRTVLLVGSGLLIALALASVAVLVGGRLSEQTRRVGLLKAVGATPATVAAVLLIEHVAVTILAATAGLAIGRSVAPELATPGAGLLGAAGTPPITPSTVAIVYGVALAIAVLATLIPALQAARTSTVTALADTPRPPRRSRRLISLSTRLPVPLLLGVRLAARRPRRLALGVLSVAVCVAGIVAILLEHNRLDTTSGLINPQNQRMNQVMLVITVMLLVLTAVNALLITWATVLDGRHASALARALGATPRQVGTGLCATQLLAVIPGAILGIPLGIGLLEVVTGSGDAYKLEPAWWYLLIVLGACATTTILTALPARIGGRQPVARVLQSEAP